MGNKIKCVRCALLLGEINKARLRKNIVHLCASCNTKRIAVELSMKSKKSTPDNFMDNFLNGKLF